MKQWPNISQMAAIKTIFIELKPRLTHLQHISTQLRENCIGFIHSMLCLGGNGIILKYFSRLENYKNLTSGTYLPKSNLLVIIFSCHMSTIAVKLFLIARFIRAVLQVTYISLCNVYRKTLPDRQIGGSTEFFDQNRSTDRELLKSVSYVNSSGEIPEANLEASVRISIDQLHESFDRSSEKPRLLQLKVMHSSSFHEKAGIRLTAFEINDLLMSSGPERYTEQYALNNYC
uniref:Uncharacterized protein n=1 Tax=Glossina austeni TaxID=7395 RepID=A0A1A9UDX9_GLOAU